MKKQALRTGRSGREMFWLAALLSGSCLFGAGCHMAGSGFRASPLSTVQQRQEIEKIVPLGTSRNEVEKLLQDAGIQMTPGASDSIVYCDIWNRAGGERWTLNVALLFDESGKLYATRSAQAETGVLSESLPPSRRTAQEVEDLQSSDPRKTDPQNAEKEETNLNRADTRRTPFQSSSPSGMP